MEAVVTFEYGKTQEDELDLRVGEIISDVIKVDDGWCEGRLNGKTGLFPDNFVDIRPVSTPAPAHQSPPSHQAPSTSSVPLRNLDVSKKVRRAKVTYSYAADNADELNLQPGQIVEILEEEEEEEGWMRGKIGNAKGVFPSNFVEELNEPNPVETARPPSPDPTPAPVPNVDSQTGERHEGFNKPPGTRGPMPMMVMPSFDPSKVKLKSSKGTVAPPLEKPPEHKKSAPPPAKLPEKVTERAKVTFDYDADNSDELTIRVGETVDIISKDNEQDGWWEVSLGGKRGLIPNNFIEVLPPPVVPQPAPIPSQPSPPQPKKPLASQPTKEPPPTKHPPPAKLKKTEAPKKPPAHGDDQTDFPVPKTIPLDTSAIKERPKNPKSRPPSRSNLLVNQDTEGSVEDNALPEASGNKALSPWQTELKKKKQPKPVPPKPAGKPKIPPTQRPDDPLPRPRLMSKDKVSKPDPPIVTRTRLNTGGSKPDMSAKPPTPVASSKPSHVPKPVEAKPSPPPPTEDHPPPSTPTPPPPAAATPPPPSIPVAAPVVVTDNAWKEAYEKLREDFENFKVKVAKNIEILTDDLDKERKHRAGMDIDIDRLKKAKLPLLK